MRKAFTFYGSYYQSIKELPKENQNELYKAIIEYSFEKIEPKLSGISTSIWYLIKPNIDNNISRYENGIKPKNKEKKEQKSETEAKQKQNRSNPLSLSLSFNLNKEYYNNKELNKIFKEYLQLRTKLKAVNSERAINTLLNKLSKYDDNTKYAMIEQSILKSWKDVYEIKGEVLPKWFNEKPIEEELTEAEEQKLKEALKKYK